MFSFRCLRASGLESPVSTALFEQLRAGSGPLWAAAQQHPFVSALADGSLPRESFAFFLQQDYAFLLAYSRALALATARCAGEAQLASFSGLLHATLSEELQLHRQYCAEFGLSPADLAATLPSPVCQAYGDFCVATAASGGPLELLCALLPCGVGYHEIGQRLREQIEADASRWPDGLYSHPYGRWIEVYSSSGFGEYAQWMTTSLDEMAALQGPQPQQMNGPYLQRLQRLLDTGCRYEWLFWETAWTRENWPI